MTPPATTAEASRTVTILNKLGMHARAAVKFVQTANRFRCEVKVVKDDQEANGKSIMGLLTLVAAHGVSMTIVCAGDDAPAAVDALAALVGTGFGEGIRSLMLALAQRLALARRLAPALTLLVTAGLG